MIKKVLAPLASLRLTVVLIVVAMVLVYVGTWAQVDSGSWQVQKKYFHSFYTWVDLGVLVPRTADGGYQVPGGFPMPGGYSVGLLMLINLVAAHVVRFKFAKRRIGIILIHLGVIMLLLGEGLTSWWAVESQMMIDEGSSTNFSRDIRQSELAVSEPSNPGTVKVVVVGDEKLKEKGTIKDSRLPFDLRIDQYYENSMRAKLRPSDAPRVTKGDGVHWAMERRRSYSGAGTEAGRVDEPSAYVTPIGKDGKELGTWLLSLQIDHPQEVEVEGKKYLMELRFKRLYKPYTMHLIDFAHDKYTGTTMAKNFSSLVRLVDPGKNYDREVKIWMNHPLRYGGETFYQADFKNADKTTVLQVVDNPGWLLPYVACIIGGIGMIVHFGIKLTEFIRKKTKQLAAAGAVGAAEGSVLVNVPEERKQKSEEKNQKNGKRDKGKKEYVLLPRPWWTRSEVVVPAAVVSIMMLWAIGATIKNTPPSETYDFVAFGKLPMSFEGRTQPIDSVARNSLRIMNGSEIVRIKKEPQEPGKRAKEEPQPPIKMLADIMITQADDVPMFRVGHAQVQNVLNLDEKKARYSLKEIAQSGGAKFDEEFKAADRQRRADRNKLDSYQKNILELGEHLSLFQRLRDIRSLYLLPPLKEGEDWQPLGKGVTQGMQPTHPAAEAWLKILTAYAERKPAEFNRAVEKYQKELDQEVPGQMRKIGIEGTFNIVEPFMRCLELYLVAFLLIILSWVFFTKPLSRASGALIAVAFVIHTIALILRIYISGRPPVTNLYSSAIFIAWGIVLLGMGLEYYYRNGVGMASAAVSGFLSMIIAQNLAADGDTMKMLQAVLDTNFWLATHVVIVTLGYAATFLAGFIGIAYVIQGVLGRTMTPELSKEMGRMIYGVVCFGILFSFVGTVLGGIWADQSWGRFWGWDPKENGAVLIVLWNALVLHARWAGLVRERGLAVLSIGGNIITSWSWFGTNMLGVGLHSYGFMDSALLWLLVFVGSQLALMAVGMTPLDHWRSKILENPADQKKRWAVTFGK
jgi:ABC-type transport system involved in cytochrome c biogenesis permease subunit